MSLEEISYYAKLELPLEQKITLSLKRIDEWFNYTNGKMYISYSGGKDSTVLLHLVRKYYQSTPAVFCNTGLEYPEIIRFVKNTENVTWIKPKMSFKEVIEEYGYPIISKEQSKYIKEYRTTKSEKLKYKRMFGVGKDKVGKISEKWKYLLDAPFKISDRCCYVMKKGPFDVHDKESGCLPFIGIMGTDSRLRELSIVKNGCNAISIKRPQSRPLGVWTEQDIWKYIKQEKLDYCNIYDNEITNTGCMFCLYGMHMEDIRHQRLEYLRKHHKKTYDYCMEELGFKEVLKWYPKRIKSKGFGFTY